MSIVIGQVSQIMTGYLSIDILKAYSWDSFISLSYVSIEQLKFWKSNLNNLNIKDIYESNKCSKIVYSDASSTGFAGYEVNTAIGMSYGMWSPEESKNSSTWRELMAVSRCIKSLGHFLCHLVKWFTDNQGVTTIVRKGSMNKELQNIAFDVFNICISKSIQLEIEWIFSYSKHGTVTILFLCFSVLLVLRLPRLGKRELILVLFVRLFGLYLFRFVGFLFLLGSGKGCGL